ncbi:MAG: hypothetical protein AAFQ87_27555, partial [Bacteroidota bacterium]
MRFIIFILNLTFLSFYFLPLNAQVFVEKQSRHRFAQLAFGADVRYLFMDGQSQYLQTDGSVGEFSFGNVLEPRLTLSGLHFWGYAEFYVSFPLRGIQLSTNDEVAFSYSSSVETGGRFYPTQIQHGKLAPYIGLSFNSNFYRQRVRSEEEVGPGL